LKTKLAFSSLFRILQSSERASLFAIKKSTNVDAQISPKKRQSHHA